MAPRRLRLPSVLAPMLLAGIVLICAFGGFAAPYDAAESVGPAFARPGPEFVAGTDQLGRDVLSRFLALGWPVLVLPAFAVAMSTCVGVGLGLVLAAGPNRGRRIVQALDVLLALPPVLLLMVIAFTMGSGLATMVLIVVVLSAPFTARYTRSLADRLVDSGYVEVALAEGRSPLAVAFGEILPNLYRPLLADVGNRFVGAVYLVASASFLGVSPVGGAGDWASMVSDSLGGIAVNPASIVLPAAGIAALTVSANAMADRWKQR